MVKKLFYFALIIFSNIELYSQDIDSIVYLGISVAEEMPVFDGELESFINEHIHYPYQARKDSIEGKVFVQFWVDTTGLTMGHLVIKGVSKELDKEALRITRLIKFKKSAMQRGKPIKIRYTVPVDFKLSIKSEPKKNECK